MEYDPPPITGNTNFLDKNPAGHNIMINGLFY
jgi:hypothetical protein